MRRPHPRWPRRSPSSPRPCQRMLRPAGRWNQSGPPSPPPPPAGSTITRSSAGTGLPLPSLLDVVIQNSWSSPLPPTVTVSSLPYFLSSNTCGEPVNEPCALIVTPTSCWLVKEVLANWVSPTAQSAAPPCPCFQVHSASLAVSLP